MTRISSNPRHSTNLCTLFIFLFGAIRPGPFLPAILPTAGAFSPAGTTARRSHSPPDPGDDTATDTTITTTTMTFKVFVLRHGQTDANAAGVIQGSGDFSRLTTLGKEQAAESLRAFYACSDDDDNGTINDGFQTETPLPMMISSIYCSPLRRAQETLQVLRQQEMVFWNERNKDAPLSAETRNNSNSSNRTMARRILLPPTQRTLENLREIDFYDWEGRGKAELEAKFPTSWKAWEEGDPHRLMVLDTTTATKQAGNGDHPQPQQQQPQERYPLVELWNRADQVWDEIWDHEQQERGSSGWVDDDDSRTTMTTITTPLVRSALIVAHGSLGQALLGTAMGWGATEFRTHEFPNCGMAEIEWDVDWSQLNHKTTKLETGRRPLAVRWRWKWPPPSSHGWSTSK